MANVYIEPRPKGGRKEARSTTTSSKTGPITCSRLSTPKRKRSIGRSSRATTRSSPASGISTIRKFRTTGARRNGRECVVLRGAIQNQIVTGIDGQRDRRPTRRTKNPDLFEAQGRMLPIFFEQSVVLVSEFANLFREFLVGVPKPAARKCFIARGRGPCEDRRSPHRPSYRAYRFVHRARSFDRNARHRTSRTRSEICESWSSGSLATAFSISSMVIRRNIQPRCMRAKPKLRRLTSVFPRTELGDIASLRPRFNAEVGNIRLRGEVSARSAMTAVRFAPRGEIR